LESVRTRHHVFICNGGSCLRKQADEVTEAIREEIAVHQADHYIHTTRTRCNGRCEDACVVIVYPEGVWYKDVTPESGRSIVTDHLVEGKVIDKDVFYYYKDGLMPSEKSVSGTKK
jgi:(2Fe-2S) ferredoxin